MQERETIMGYPFGNTKPILKKTILLLCLVMAFSLSLGACGDETENTGGSGQESTTYDFEGCLEDFETVDLDGNAVTQEIFAQNEITVIDIWGTYCGPCIESFPDMERIYAEYKDRGIGIVGLVIDCQNDDLTANPAQAALAKDILSENGVTYPQILLADNFGPLMKNVMAIPTYIFVDSTGRPIESMYIGVRSYDEWKTTMERLVEKYGL